MAETKNVSVTMPNDTVYVSGIVNGTEYVFTLSGTTDAGTVWTADVARASPDVYVCSITAINSLGNSRTVETTLYYGLQLITDRTKEDVARALKLSEKGLENMTAAELEEYLAGLKGAYNASDMNRVESAVKYIADRFTVVGMHPEVDVHVLWDRSMYPDPAEMYRYLANIITLRALLTMAEDVPQVPPDMDKLNYEEANDIEKILLAVDDAITRISKSWYYSGDIYAGEV